MCGVSQGLVKAWWWLGMSWSECEAVTRDKTSPGLGWLLGWGWRGAAGGTQ